MQMELAGFAWLFPWCLLLGRPTRRSKSRKLVGVGNGHCIARPLPLGCQHLDTCTCLMLFCPCILLRQKRNGLVKGELVWCCLLPTLCMLQVRLLHLLPSFSWVLGIEFLNFFWAYPAYLATGKPVSHRLSWHLVGRPEQWMQFCYYMSLQAPASLRGCLPRCSAKISGSRPISTAKGGLPRLDGGGHGPATARRYSKPLAWSECQWPLMSTFRDPFKRGN